MRCNADLGWADRDNFHAQNDEEILRHASYLKPVNFISFLCFESK